MADITSRVRFIGDAQQLLATYKAIGAQATALNRQINAANNNSFLARGLNQRAGGIAGLPGGDTFRGPVIKNVKTEIDALNRTFKAFGDTAVRTGHYGDIITGTFSEVKGDLDKLIPAVQKYDQVFGQTRGIRASTKATREWLQAQRDAGVTLRDASGRFTSPGKAALEYGRAQIASIRPLYQEAKNAISSALASAPPVPASIQQLERVSPQLLRKLQQQGLSTDSATLYKQGANVDFSRDLIRQTTRISGAFTDLKTGIAQNFNAELDKSGKLVTRFGGQLSGLQNFLEQTVRNFQKVVQWGIATTAVLGTIALAARELGVLTELNTNLNRLGVTANLTREETKGLFSELATIAISTATPLTEITKSADDIALAVREAGKSSQDYQTDILNLTQAVGIYTNLTGTDTVRATELLTSSMKQLGIETEDITGLLSKITAVAGGQSNAIADITQGLAAMAEAARNAGLSVDRTIATVQILSQVTAKTPAEIATAFKNLVGALENPAAIKQLNALNIDLISQGNNIIDIYKSIAEQVRTGQIASTEVSGVLRNLAGGPRRAPDAAALLSNIDKIASTEARAVRATNEALIVNAKVLDTVSARLTILQAKFDKILFEKFSGGFEAAVNTVAGAVGGLLDFVDKIPTGVITATIQVGLFFAALRLGIGVVNLLIRAVGGLAGSLATLPGAFRAAGTAATGFNTATGLATGAAGKGGRLGGAGLGIAGGALLGAGISAASGGNLGQIIGTGLSGAGLAALTAPVPLPWLKVGGAIAFAAGTLLTFATNSEDASKAADENARNAEKLLNVYAGYSEAKFTLSDLEKEQDNLRQSMKTLQAEQSPESLAGLADAQRQYIDNAILMANANLELAKSMEEIAKLNPQLAQAIRGVSAGQVRPEAVEGLIQELQLQLLRQTDPTANLPGNVSILPPVRAPITQYKPRPGPFEGPSTLATVQKTEYSPRGNIPIQVEAPFDLTQLEADAGRVVDLFDEAGKSITASFAPTGENIGIVQKAIKDLSVDNAGLAATLRTTFDLWVQQRSAIDGAALVLQSYSSRVAAVKFFDPNLGADLERVLAITTQIVEQAGKAGDSEGIFQALTRAQGIIESGGPLTKSQLQPILEQAAQYMGLLDDAALSTTDKFVILDQVSQSFGFNFQYAAEGASAAMGQVNEDIQEAIDKMHEFSSSLQADLAQRAADLQARFQGGEYKDNEGQYRKELNYLSAVAEGVQVVEAEYERLAGAMGGELDAAVQQLAEGLTDINGLQDAQSLTAQQLIERMFGLADTYGFTGAEAEKLTQKMMGIFKAAELISKLRVSFPIIANLNLTQAIKALKALRAATYAAANSGVAYPSGLNSNPTYTGLDAAIAALVDANTGFTSGSGSIGSLFGSSGGTGTYRPPSSKSGGAKAKKGPGYDVSTLDLPEEIANAANRDALIALAVKNAKALQSKIPGATTEGKNDIVELLKGTQQILEVRGIKDDLLRKALEELADIEKKRLEFETKADTIARIRVGGVGFDTIANVPVNSRTGVSLGGAEGPIGVTINLNGTVLTPAQFSQFADMIAASLKRQIAS